MNLIEPTHPRLRAASAIALIVAAVLSVFAVMTAFRVMDRYTSVFALPIVVCLFAMPAGLVWAGIALRRGKYAAWLTLWVLSILLFTASFLPIVFSLRLVGGMNGFMQPALAVVLAVAAIIARPVMAYFPDVDAVERALCRTAIGLRVAAGLMALAGVVAIVGLLIAALHSHLETRSMMMIPVAIIFGGCSIAASVTWAMARGSVHRERPSVGAIVFVAVVACFSAYLTQMLRFGTNWAFAWCANTIVTGLAIWLLVDLLHSRRQIVEPQSYGFAPIVAQPVQNLTTPPASN